MTTQDEIRTDLDSELFNADIAKTVILTSYTTTTTDDWGDITSSQSTSELVIVPYNLTEKQREYNASGTMSAGDFEAAVRYDVTVNQDDMVTMEGIDYDITAIAPNYLPDNVVTIITLAKKE